MAEVLRTCCVCRKVYPKKEMIRIVKNKEGKIFIDNSGKSDGRGAYICDSDDCKLKAKKLKSLNKTFKCQISDEIYDKLFEKKEI